MSFIQRKMIKYVSKILSLPYLSKRTIFLADVAFIAVIYILSTLLCYSFVSHPVYIPDLLVKLGIAIVINCLFFVAFSTYKGVLRYSSIKESMRILLSLFCANITLLIVTILLYDETKLSLMIIFINFILGSSIIVFFRLVVRLFFDYIKTFFTIKKDVPLLIFGTKLTHISLATMIRDNEYLPYSIAGFISSESQKSKQKIMNYPIYCRSEFFTRPDLFQHIKAVLIIPEELQPSEKQMLVEKCALYKMDLLSAPSLEDWKMEDKRKRKINKVRIEDLLRRFPIRINTEAIKASLKGKTILITGAAGSIGSELVRQLCHFDVKQLLLCDIAETPLHQLGLELSDNHQNVKIELLIADVRNYDRMKSIFEKYRPEYVFHAAAYKHVPLMEMQPSEAILANVLGTKNIADLTIANQSECFVMISTDKAVNPSSVMGASKRIAEIYIQYLVHHGMNKTEKTFTRFITTRFGNVLGSNGSVIPRFTKQIESGGPITVTDPEIFRYFMTISEACNLVLEAGNIGQGGEIFAFDMGEAVKIKDMAEDMIRLSGLIPYKDIDIVFSGLRPGEKLYEELLYDKERLLPTSHDSIMISKHTENNYEKLLPTILHLIEIAGHEDQMKIVKYMKKIVPEFVSQNSCYQDLDSEVKNK